MRCLLLIALALLALLQPAIAATVEGRVVQGDTPVTGVRVAAYADLDFTARPLAVAEPTDAEGLYRLELPAGGYAFYVVAPERKLFAFCGRNPVAVGAQPEWVGLQAVATTAAKTRAYDDAYSAAIEGRVTVAGQPVADAYVYLYVDAADALKGQGYRISPPTGEDGSFYFDGLPDVGYFLVARKRADGGRVGPVRAGDWLGIYPGNPLKTRAGEALEIELPLVQKLKSEASSETFAIPGGPQLTGRIVDTQGQPVAGVHAFAYRDRVIGHQRPETLSSPTAADGRFELNFAAGGTYFIGARQLYGDSPAPGELFGMYGGRADHGLEIIDGDNAEVQIVVEPIDLQ